MTKSSAAYIAGFFDGEGCVYERDPGRFKITIAQNQVDVLKWIRKRLGYGRIYGPYARSQYTLNIARKADVLEFALLVLPYSKVKREQLLRVIQ